MSYRDDLKKPVNLISLFLGILGIVLSIYFYVDSIKSKKISYFLKDVPSVIFDNTNSTSAVKLYERDTILITRSVYLLSGFIWNSGDLTITKEDIRAPITIKLNDNNRILDFKITKQKDPSIAGFILKRIDNTSLELDWKYFDPNFGVAFQLIYEGDINPNFQLDGKILDISKFTQAKINVESTKFWTSSTIFFFIAIPIGIIMIIVDKKRQGKVSWPAWLFIISLTFGLILKFWKYFFDTSQNFPI